MKKVLSLVLVMAMVLSSMSFAFAAVKEYTDLEDSAYEKAIMTLSGLGVLDGYEDGTFRPEKTVTRAEMAKILTVALGYGDLVAGSKSNFVDCVGHWADSYIALAAGKGLVVGTGDGKFDPDRTVTYDEVWTMLVRGLGYTDTCNEITGTWPANFKVKAAELGITKNVTISESGADRGGVAQALANALECTLVTVDTDGNVVNVTETIDGDKSDKILLSRLATKKTVQVIPEMLDTTSRKYAGEVVDLEPYMYQTIVAYVNLYDNDVDDEFEVVYVKQNKSVVVEGKLYFDDGNAFVDALLKDTDGNVEQIKIEDINGKTYTLDVNGRAITAYYNGEDTSLSARAADADDLADTLYNYQVASVTVVVNDEDGNDNGKADNGEEIIAMVVNKPTNGILVDTDYIEGKTKISGDSGSIKLPTDDDEVALDRLTVTGAVESLEDIKADDVVIAYQTIDTDSEDFSLKLEVVRNTVEGAVTKTNSSANTVYIDGESYSTSRIKNSIRYNDPSSNITVGDEGVFYLDNAGKLFAIDTDTELSDYALILNSANGNYSTRMDGSVDDYPQLKLLTQDDETIVYDVLVTLDNDNGTIVLDDVAEYDGNNLVKLNSTGQVIEFVPSSSELKAGTLIKYTTDSNGYIDEIEFVDVEDETIDSDDLADLVSDNVVIFGTKDDYEVLSLTNVKDGKHGVVYKSGKIVVIVSSNVDSTNDNVYGVISSLNYVKDSSGDRVVEVTAFVDGEKVTYLTRKTATIGNKYGDVKLSSTSTAAGIKFEFNTSDVLTGVYEIDDTKDSTLTVNGVIDKADSSKITFTNGTTKYFTSDCAVYIYDISDDDIAIGDVNDLDEGLTATAYVLDTDATSRVGMVVVVQP